MNCNNTTPTGDLCGHSETQHPDGGPCKCCGCTKLVFTVFRADEEGNVRPPSVEIEVEKKRDDEPTKDFDTSDVNDEDTQP